MSPLFDSVINKSRLIFEPNELTVQISSDRTSFSIRSESPLHSPADVAFYVENLEARGAFSLDKSIVSILANDTSKHMVHLLANHAVSDVNILANCTREACLEELDLAEACLRLTIVHSLPLNVIITVFGWIYFFAWSISFYPQIFLNFKRKSVIGLNFDFLLLNIVGFLFYALYNCALYWIPEVQAEYLERFPKKVLPVLLNDVVFALHALFACLVTTVQCFCYQRGNQRISWIALGITTFDCGVALTSLFITMFTALLLWLDFFNILSYIKLSITLIKYVPQAVFNYRRKSTIGWSIGNILLDFTGGTMSLLQMILIAYNTDSFHQFFGNFTKFGLGFISLLFDLVFIFQHYVLYRHSADNYDTFNEQTPPDQDTESIEEAN